MKSWAHPSATPGSRYADAMAVSTYEAAQDRYDTMEYRGLRVKMCVWLGVSRGLDLAFLNAD